MLDAIREAIKLREERVTLGGVMLVVRELETAAAIPEDVPVEDIGFYLLIRCVVDEPGNPVFDATDIPALKSGSKRRLLPLIQAVGRVNGLDAEDNAKNSEAVQP